ncbi:MAG: ABC transporter ATP-binding protein [Candidatus Symbiobacter sp.]|nr:ABC transporter ATP-binding protein [Candidatus Symbiobacter sp.]
MLNLNAINCFYGAAQALFQFSLEVRAGEIMCLLGRNGAGKTTALRSIIGQIRPHAGSIIFDGTDISRLNSYQIPGFGIGYVPQGRRLFAELTVRENLEIGLLGRKSAATVSSRGQQSAATLSSRSGQILEHVYHYFPRLAERSGQLAGTLSGGEQQMLAIGRALCLQPKLIMLDEPTEGLQPSMIDKIRDVIVKLKQENVTVILVEQRVDAVLAVADRVAFIGGGRVHNTVDVAVLRHDRALINHYVGLEG